MSHQRIGLINTLGTFRDPGLDFPLRQAVRAGRYVFLRGQTGLALDSKSFVGAGDPAAQAEQAMENVRVLLGHVGARLDDIAKITTYVVEREHGGLVYPVVARHIEGVAPVWTGIVCQGLAEEYIDFEIDVFAVVAQS